MSSKTRRTHLQTLFALVLSFGLVSCQTVKKAPSRTEVKPPTTIYDAGQTSSLPPESSSRVDEGSEVEAPIEQPMRPPAEKPRIALILGPGGLRAFAHAGVLQEIHRTQLPIQFIAGLEMGALPAALYSLKPQAFEAEWQMMKLKESDISKRSLISGAQSVDLKDWRSYLQTVFGSARMEDARLPFTCLSFNQEKYQTMILSKGAVTQSLPYCLSYPPLFRAYEGHQAAASQLTVLARQLRQKGATHVIYVDLLGDKSRLLPKGVDDNVSLIWMLTQAHLASQGGAVDDILRIQISDDITSFARRRDMIRQGKDSAKKSLAPLLKKYGVD